MAETLSLLSAISFGIAGISLGAAVFFGILFKIPSVIGGLTGRTARKSIEKMRASDEKERNKYDCENQMNTELGKLAAVMSGGRKTELLNPNKSNIPDMKKIAAPLEERMTEPLKRNVQFTVPEKDFVMLDEIILIHTDETIE